jgi:hypothetical protein
MWYQNKTILAGVYDTLASVPLIWAGNLKQTFSNISPYSNRPNPDAIPQFVTQYVIPILTNYSKDENFSTEEYYDLLSYADFARYFIDYYLKQEKIPRATYVLIETLGLASKILVDKNYPPFILTEKSYRADDASYAQTVLNLDYGYLKAIAQAGIYFSNEFLYYVISGNDIKDNPSRAGDGRNKFVEYFTQTHPYTKYYLPSNHKNLINLLSSSNNDELVDVLKKSNLDEDSIKDVFIDASSFSGAPKEEVFPFLKSYIENPNTTNIQGANYLTTPYPAEYILKYIKSIYDNKLNIPKNNLEDLLNSFMYKIDELDDIKSLQNMPEIMDVINNVTKDSAYLTQQKITSGLGSLEETIEFLEKSPENIKKMKTVAFIPQEITNKYVEKQTNYSKTISTDIASAFKDAINTGAITKTTANQDSFIMNFLLEEGVKNAGLTKEDIQGYANYLTVYKYNGTTIKYNYEILFKRGINGIDFSGSTSGQFAPSFIDPIDNVKKPAIFVRTDISSSAEYLKGLAENLKLSLSSFTDAVAKHEASHALHYLGVGDATMESPVLTQFFEKKQRQQELKSMSDEERERQPAKIYESDEMLYLTDPSEIYARVHGDIPHLVELFKQKIESLKDNPLVAEAVENQWVDDVVGTLAGVASGGTNAARLQKDLARGQGWISESDNPIQVINKILSRQETKLRAAYQEDIAEEQKKAALNILREINKKKAEITDAVNSGQSTYYLEEQLKNLQQELKLVRYRRVFNVDGMADLILSGYLKDYMMRLTDAVGAGTITTDRIQSQETLDEIKERQNELKNKNTEDYTATPTASDIRDLSDSIIEQSGLIPGGRKFDFMLRTPLPENERSGFYPHLESQQTNTSN